jgi:hypothetical protein
MHTTAEQLERHRKPNLHPATGNHGNAAGEVCRYLALVEVEIAALLAHLRAATLHEISAPAHSAQHHSIQSTRSRKTNPSFSKKMTLRFLVRIVCQCGT